MMSLHCIPLFVFSNKGPIQNARSLLTPVSGPAFYALSHGSLYFVLHGNLSPIDGISPEDLKIDILENQLKSELAALGRTHFDKDNQQTSK